MTSQKGDIHAFIWFLTVDEPAREDIRASVSRLGRGWSFSAEKVHHRRKWRVRVEYRGTGSEAAYRKAKEKLRPILLRHEVVLMG